MPERISEADLHIHSQASDGQAGYVEIVRRASELGLAVIAITDHETIEESIRAYNFTREHPELGVEAIVGLEHTTDKGHLVILFKNPQQALSSRDLPRQLASAIYKAKEYEALIIIPHPGLKFVGIDPLLPTVGMAHGIETLNGFSHAFGPMRGWVIADPFIVESMREGHELAAIGSSDAHNLDIGSARTRFRGQSADDLRLAIEQKTTSARLNKDNLPNFSDYLRLAVANWHRFGTLRFLGSLANRPFITPVTDSIKKM